MKPYLRIDATSHLADTAHLTTEEQGAYFLILLHYCQTGAPVPESQLAAMVGASKAAWSRMAPELQVFFVVRNGLWRHRAMDLLINEARTKTVKRRKAGIASGKKRQELRKGTILPPLQAIDNVEKSNTCSTRVQHVFDSTAISTGYNPFISPPLQPIEKPKKTNKCSKTKSTRMKRPTLEEIQAYCREKKYPVDAEAFLAHYESNGWKVGRNPMKNWKAAVVTWATKSRTPTTQRTYTGTPHDRLPASLR